MKNTSKKSASTAVSASTVSALASNVLEGVRAIRSTEKWAEMLKFQTGFWHYSWNNQILIWLQSNGKATKVAGYKAWQKKGYNTKKGEKGMKILRPIFVKEVNEKAGVEEYVLRGFTTCTVFDIKQTTCEEIPSVWSAPEKECDKALDLVASIKKLSFVKPCNEDAKEEGSYHPSTGEIKVKFGGKANATAETFLHEYCHKMVNEDLKNEKAGQGMDYATEEIVVESSAYILCNLAGIDVESSSFAYVACWLNNGKKEDEEITNALDRIHKVTNAAIESLKKQGIELLPEASKEEAED